MPLKLFLFIVEGWHSIYTHTMGVAADYVSRTRIGAYFHEARESRKLVLLIVAIALLLDNMLLTTVGKYN